MSLSTEEIEQVAHLARLDITEDEIAQLSTDLNKVFGHIDNLSTLDTEGVEPLASSLASTSTPRRDDIEHVSDSLKSFRDNIADNAPDMEGNFIKVPKMS